MGIVPAAFTYERKSLLPILRITGRTRNMPGLESALLMQSLEIIEKLEKYNGKVTQCMGHEAVENLSSGMIAIRFYIIFPNEEEYARAIQGIEKEEFG